MMDDEYDEEEEVVFSLQQRRGGEEDEGGSELAARGDVIVVRVESRRGALGFLALGDEIPGNAGLLDQVMALQWVKDNIDRFGGLSDRVTIMGVRDAADLASLHLLSPLSCPLFQAAILMSGATPPPLPSTEDKASEAVALGHQLRQHFQSGLNAPVDDGVGRVHLPRVAKDELAVRAAHLLPISDDRVPVPSLQLPRDLGDVGLQLLVDQRVAQADAAQQHGVEALVEAVLVVPRVLVGLGRGLGAVDPGPV